MLVSLFSQNKLLFDAQILHDLFFGHLSDKILTFCKLAIVGLILYGIHCEKVVVELREDISLDGWTAVGKNVLADVLAKVVF